MFNNMLFRAMCCLLLLAVALGQVKTITLKDGREITGQVTKTDEGYQVRTKFGVVTFSAEQVASIVDVVTPEQEYQKRLAKIDPDKSEDHFALGKWAMGRGLLQIARKELSEALRLRADHEEASLLLRQVEAKIREATRPPKTVPATAPTGPAGPAVRPEWLVSQEEIYRIRLEELRPSDTVVVEFRNNVLERFIDKMAGTADFKKPRFDKEFRAMSNTRKVIYILEQIDPDDSTIKDNIIIKSDPKFMVDFRSRVWPIVSRHCASSNCHGGPKGAGGLKLFNTTGRDERVIYTNFAILEMYASGGRRIIDRNDPSYSLLLQYGLPPKQAKFKHPAESKFAFANRKVVSYRRVMEWINSLQPPAYYNYRLKYRPPSGPKPVPAPPSDATTKPAGGTDVDAEAL